MILIVASDNFLFVGAGNDLQKKDLQKKLPR